MNDLERKQNYFKVPHKISNCYVLFSANYNYKINKKIDRKISNNNPKTTLNAGEI